MSKRNPAVSVSSSSSSQAPPYTPKEGRAPRLLESQWKPKTKKEKNNRNPTKHTTKTEKKKQKNKGVMRSGCEDLREDYEGSGINRIRKEKQRQKNIQTQRRAEEDRKIKKTNPSSQRAPNKTNTND